MNTEEIRDWEEEYGLHDTVDDIKRVAYLLYTKHGQNKVYEFASLLNWDEEQCCHACEVYESPHIDGQCMVCGNAKT